MPRDYQKKRNVRQGRSASGRFLWILASFLGGYLTATLFDFTSLSAWVSKQVQGSQQAQPAPKVARKTDLPKPKFEFYTLLARDSSSMVPVNKTAPASLPVKPVTSVVMAPAAPLAERPPQPAAVAVAASKPAPRASVVKEAWLVQIASFNKRSDAERLKASLTLQGFDVGIASIAKNGTAWFRVTIGPFSSHSQAEKAQILVAKTERMRGMIKKSATG